MSETLLEVRHLRKSYSLPGAVPARWLARARVPRLQAVDDVGFEIARGEALGLVGESGCGKSTLAGLVARLDDPDSGEIRFKGEDLARWAARTAARAPWRSDIQMVFQDPGDSLDPRRNAFDAIAAPLRLLKGLSGDALRRRVHAAAEHARLPATLLARRPHQLSGGQAARVGIARALALEPALLVLDEPTSALDVSIQLGILRLLDELRRDLGISYLFVSHDLQVVRLLCQRVLVMYLGRIVEAGETAQVFDHPAHPYSEALASAAPLFGGVPGARPLPLSGEPRSPIDPSPQVCRFEDRCLRAEAECRLRMPQLHAIAARRAVACHFPLPHAAPS